MTQTFDLRQGLEQARADRGAAWQFIRDFAREWVTPLADIDGWAQADLVEAEARLGLALPPALREAYLLLGRRRDLTSNHDVLLNPAQLYVDSEALVFRHENQGACSWGILLSDLGLRDPAVSIKPDLADKQAEQWEPWMGCLSGVFVEIVMSESLHAPQGLSDFLYDLSPEDQQIVEEHCTRLPFPAYPANGFQSTRWFLGKDVLLRDEGDCLLVRARTEEALNALRELLLGDWLNA